MVFRTIINSSLAKRIPSIKFRKGGNIYETPASHTPQTAPASNQSQVSFSNSDLRNRMMYLL